MTNRFIFSMNHPSAPQFVDKLYNLFHGFTISRDNGILIDSKARPNEFTNSCLTSIST